MTPTSAYTLIVDGVVVATGNMTTFSLMVVPYLAPVPPIPVDRPPSIAVTVTPRKP